MRKMRFCGDTIVEAMFSITIFSLVIASSFSIMNQGSATAERSLEITQVRQEINAQAEMLRFLNASYIAKDSLSSGWQQIDTLTTGNTSSVTSFPPAACPDVAPNNSFILNTANSEVVALNSSTFKPATTFARVYNGTAYGIWIEGKKNVTQDSMTYIDFYIRACWDDPSRSAPMTLDTVVRLYEP